MSPSFISHPSQYSIKHPEVELLLYTNGYKGLLLGESIAVTPAIRAQASALHLHGGSPIGNSRVKLTNIEDCVKRGLTVEGENPLHRAAEQLMMDQVTDAASFDSPVPLRHRRATSPSDEADRWRRGRSLRVGGVATRPRRRAAVVMIT